MLGKHERGKSMAENAKEKIVKALIELMSQKGIEEITVKELCINARIHRSTYYYHFYTVEEIVEYLMNSFLEQLKNVVTYEENMTMCGERQGNLMEKSIAFYNFVKQHLQEYKTIINSKYKHVFYEKLVKMVQEQNQKYEISYVIGDKSMVMNKTEKRFWSYQASWCIVGILECWKDRDFKDDPEELLKLSYGIFTASNNIEISVE